jgi:hypothetical protein
MFGQNITLKQIKNIDEFFENYYLTNEAKLFGLARAVAQTERLVLTHAEIFSDFLVFAILYSNILNKI